MRKIEKETANMDSTPMLGSGGSHITHHASRPLPLLRLCQLVSPALPIGAYHFSQGLEYSVHANWITDEKSACEWISGLAHNAVGTLDLPIMLRMYDAWTNDDQQAVSRWNRYLIASRETSELRAEERHVGKALAKVLIELEIDAARAWLENNTSYAAMFSLAAASWKIDRSAMAQGYLWAWTENQMLAALKLLPIGQAAGQRILNSILPSIPDIVDHAISLDDGEIGIATPLHGMASCWHETQYSRLFRS